jgi:hypothetical protein
VGVLVIRILYSDWGFSYPNWGFPCFFISCKANARVKLAKTGHGFQSSTLVIICVVRLLFVLFYVLFVCKCVLPPRDNPIAVNKYVIYHKKETFGVTNRILRDIELYILKPIKMVLSRGEPGRRKSLLTVTWTSKPMCAPTKWGIISVTPKRNTSQHVNYPSSASLISTQWTWGTNIPYLQNPVLQQQSCGERKHLWAF